MFKDYKTLKAFLFRDDIDIYQKKTHYEICVTDPKSN